MAETWKELRRLQSKRTKIIAQISFLQQCRQQGINPQSAIPRSQLKSKHTKRVNNTYSSKIVAAMIQDKRSQLDSVSYSSYITHLKLAKECQKAEMDKYVTRLHFSMEQLMQATNNKHRRKLEWLRKKQTTSTTESNEIKPKAVNFHNLANVVLSKEEREILELGPKYCFALPVNHKNTITEIEDVLTAVPVEQRDYIRGEIAKSMSKHKGSKINKDKQSKEILKNLKQKQGLSIVKADKSNQIVLINTADYHDKLQTHIDKAKCKKVRKDPTPSIKANVNKLLKDPDFPEEVAKRIITPTNPSVPKLFGRIKMHKEGNPARPVVARCSAPTYHLEKVLYNLISPLFSSHPHTINSTRQFIDKAKQVIITPNCRMFSLDVVSLYPSTPVTLALDIISKRLIESNVYTIAQVAAIMKGLRIITQSNFFRHNGNIYKQEDGAPMGSPISALLAEAVLQKVETDALRAVAFTPKMFVRYVDDCFVLLSSEQKIEDLLTALNVVHPNINFTMENEDNRVIPFLDVTVTRTDNQLMFSIYRKPSSPPLLIRNDSKHPTSYKQSALKWYMKRAKEYCTNEVDKQQEIEYIRKMAYEHGYSEEEIPRTIEKRHQESTLSLINDPKKYKYKSMSYIPQLSEKISHIVRKVDIKIAHKCKGNIYDMVRKDRDDTPTLDQQGIYRIPIVDKNNDIVSYYIGLTTRRISERIKEHQRDVIKGKMTNAIAQFTLSNNTTTPKWDDTAVLAQPSNKAQTLIREGIEIQHAKIPLCNMDPGVNSHIIWNQFLGQKTFSPPVT